MRRHERLLNRTIAILNANGIQVRAIPTTGPGAATAIARHSIESGAGLILAAGGDGTINEVANGMAGSGVPLGIIPGGTANVLACELGIGSSVEKAAHAIAKSVPHPISPGLIRRPAAEPRYFLLMAGAGLDAHIVYHLNLKFKVMAGKLAYYLGGFSQLGRSLTEFRVSVDGQWRQASFALVSRVRNYGGHLEIARGASLLHNHFEVVLFQGRNAFRYLRYMLALMARRVERIDGVTLLQASEVSFHANAARTYVQIDGECAGTLPASVEIVPNALTLLLPPAFLETEQALARVAVCA